MCVTAHQVSQAVVPCRSNKNVVHFRIGVQGYHYYLCFIIVQRRQCVCAKGSFQQPSAATAPRTRAQGLPQSAARHTAETCACGPAGPPAATQAPVELSVQRRYFTTQQRCSRTVSNICCFHFHKSKNTGKRATPMRALLTTTQCPCLRTCKSAASATALAMYPSPSSATQASPSPTAPSRLAPTFCAWHRPRSVTQGTPIHSASAVVVVPAYGKGSRPMSTWA